MRAGAVVTPAPLPLGAGRSARRQYPAPLAAAEAAAAEAAAAEKAAAEAAAAQAAAAQPTAAEAAPARTFERDDTVYYRSSSGELVPAQVVGVHREETPWFYTILCDGVERQTEANRLLPFDDDPGPAPPSAPPPAAAPAYAPPAAPPTPAPAPAPAPSRAAPFASPPPTAAAPTPGSSGAAVEAVRRTSANAAGSSGKKKGLFSSFFGGGEEKASTADPHNLALPKHLELQGLECGKMGQRVRQLNAERKFDEARRVAQERLTLAESTYGKEHLVTATCLNDVGTFAQMFRDFDRAEALFEQASKMQRKLLGDTHPHSIATLQNLMSLYAAKGDQAKHDAMKILVQTVQAGAAADAGAAPAAR